MKQKLTAAYWGLLTGINLTSGAASIPLDKPLWLTVFLFGLAAILMIVTATYCTDH